MAAAHEIAIKITAHDSTGAALGKARAGIRSISEQLTQARNALLSFYSAAQAFQQLKALANLADELRLVNARLQLAAGSVRDFAEAQKAAYDIAARAGTSYEATATLIGRLAQSARDYGLSQRQVIAVSNATAMALKVSGASAAEAAAVIRQFSQALGSGVLRGDEFNSIMENGARLAKALADGLGLPIGKLRDLAEQGMLTTDVIVRALESQNERLTREAAAMPQTIGASLAVVRNEFGRFINGINESSGVTQKLAGAFAVLARNMEPLLGGAVVAAVAGLTVAFARGAQAVYGYVYSTVARIAADRQAAIAAQAVAANEVAKAQAMLASAQAAVANATGMARLTLVQTQLVPAQQRLAAAQAALNATMAAGTGIARGLSAALSFMGGPLGLILTLLTAGATAWALWGDRAKGATDKTRDAIERAREVSERLRREQRFGIGDAGVLREAIDALEQRRRFVEDYYAKTGSPRAARLLARLRDELQQRKRDLEFLQARESEAEGVTELGSKLFGKNFDKFVDQYRRKLNPLAAALADLREQARAAGIALDSPKFREAERIVRAAFAERRFGRAGAMTRAAAMEADLARQRLDAELEILKDGLARQKAVLDAALEDRLVSVRDYYARKTAIEQRELDAEIDRRRRELEMQKTLAANPRAAESDRLRAKGEVARLETELIVLNNRRADIEVANARAAAMAERELADALAQAREELAQLTGSDTAEQRRAAIARGYRDLRARLAAESDAEGVSLIDRLIDVKAAQANLARLEQEWRLVTEKMRTAQEAIQIQQQAGLLTEAQARRQIVALQQQSAAEMQRLLPAMQQAAQAIGPEAVLRVQAWRNELERTRLVVDEFAPVWARIGEGFGSAVQSLITGAQSLREALSGIFAQIADAFLQQVVIQPVKEWAAAQARMLAIKLGILRQEQAIEQAAAAQSVATKQAETAAKVSMDAAQAGAGAAASQAAIPIVGPALAMAAMAAMVAAVMALLNNVKRFATGGLVKGPGTGTSDSIPAWLSAGEYVIRAAAVRRVGVAFLDAINGLKSPPAWIGQRLAFAAGGLVPQVQPQPEKQVSQSVRIVNAVDPSVTHDHLQTPAGERVILNIISRNARAVRAAVFG